VTVAAAEPVTSGLAPRRAALAVLRQVRAGHRFEPALDHALAGLRGADRRLAHELAAGILRARGTLDARLAPRAARGWDAVPGDLQDILRLGAYQLGGLERVPAHAAVSTSVALARELGGRKAAGFVNAVLRRVAGDGAPAGEASDSHPAWLVARWTARFGAAETAALIEWDDRRPGLVLQPARESLEALEGRFRSAGLEPVPAPHGAGLVVGRARPESLPGYAEGAFVVQDSSQALVARFAAPAAGSLVYDACAAPGGKTVALGRVAGQVVAGDRSWRRIQRLAENLARAGSGREHPVLADAERPPLKDADLVLLDAPCLGTGTLGRRPDARWRIEAAMLDSLTALQRRLLEGCASVVRPGGVLVYATCSLEPEEDELQVERFLAEHPGFRREPAPGTDPAHLTPAGDLLLLPQLHGTDGAYAARLRRVA
jgi:16S rRNA (cytosine967-C5)-methyltransferase